MSRPLWSFLAAALVVVAAPPAAVASHGHSSRHGHSTGYAYGYDHDGDRDDDFGWMVVNGENTRMSDMTDMESLDELRDRYGDSFLYFRDGDDRYVVLERELIERADRAGLNLKMYGKELGMLARVRVQGALGSRKLAKKMAALGRRQGELGREIARRSVNGESTERLERQLEELSEDMEVLREQMHSGEATPSESRELDRKTEELSKRVQKAAREAEEEMRDIFHDAKARRLAKRVN